MKLFSIFLLLFSLASFAQINGDHIVETHFRINGKDTNHVMAGKPTTIEVWYTHKDTGEVYKDFKLMHGKIMHMVLIKDDMSVFKHIHPYHDPVTGIFQITLNLPLSDPDNFHTAEALTKGGMYMLMADVEIQDVGMRMGHKMLHAMGENPVNTILMDEVNPDGSITKFFTENGKDYKINLFMEQTAGCSGSLVEFRVSLFEKDENENYIPAQALEDWLTQGAHAVWVSDGLMHGMHHMHFAHMHSALPVDDTEFVFGFHDNKIMKSGLQRAWFQIKENGKVLTIPFTFDYQALPSAQCR
ncbi:MAG: hypothetical protein CME62_12325 [Halobacteriovoraceae bacterium]|nr:hypothetical protein [Halobacteriovoraceae bacterium]